MCTVTKKDIHENQNTKINNISKTKMNNTEIIEIILLCYFAFTVTIIVNQDWQNKEDDK